MEEQKAVEVEDLGETGPVGRSPIDLRNTPRQFLSPMTRSVLLAAASLAATSHTMPTVSVKRHPGGSSRLKPAPSSIPSRKVGRVGRNEPCPCESGKKFGKCCLPKLKIRMV